MGSPHTNSRFLFTHLIRPSIYRIALARTAILAAVLLHIFFSLFNHRISTSSWVSISRSHGIDHAINPLPDALRNPELGAFWKEFAVRLLDAKPNSTTIKPTGKVTCEEYSVDTTPAKEKSRADPIQLEEEDLLAMKQSHEEIVTVKHMAPRLPYKSKSHGIVMTAGKVHFGMAITAIRMLRRVGSGLPVELFLDSWADYDAGMCERSIPSLNARWVVLSIWNTTQKLGSLVKYQYKVFALLISSFEELIFLDADAFPVRNPDNLLDLEPYKAAGLAMWPDFWVSTASHYYYDIAGSAVPPLDFRRASESGIILYSK